VLRKRWNRLSNFITISFMDEYLQEIESGNRDTGAWGEFVEVSKPVDNHPATRGLDVMVRNPSLPMGFSTKQLMTGAGLGATALGVIMANPEVRAIGKEVVNYVAPKIKAGAKSLYKKGKDWVVSKFTKNPKKPTNPVKPHDDDWKLPLPPPLPPNPPNPDIYVNPTPSGPIPPAYINPPEEHRVIIPYAPATSEIVEAPDRKVQLAISSQDGLAPGQMTAYDIIAPGITGYHPMADAYYGRRSAADKYRARHGRGGTNVLAFQHFSGGSMDPAIAKALVQAGRRR
jgi:hypothetical protein